MENKNILIILAHPESKSFCGSMAAECEKHFRARGATVTVRDLYKLNFNPVAGQTDFTVLSEKSKTKLFQLGAEQREGYLAGTIANDIKIESELVKKADLIFFVFPFWWSSCPAIMKGYIDRVLMHGFAFDYYTNAMFNNGLLKGKQTKLFLTTGGAEEYYTPQGPHKMSVEERLEGLTYGALAFCGLNVHKSFIAHGISPVAPKDQLDAHMAAFVRELEQIENAELLYKMN